MKIFRLLTPLMLVGFAVAEVIEDPLTDNFNSIPSIINWASSFILPLATLVLLGIIIYAGFIKLTSAGNPDKEKQAMQTLTSGIVGFALIVSASLVVGILGAALGIRLLGIIK